MKKVLVAGGGGFIGGWLVKELLSKGYKVFVVDIKPISDWYQVFPEANNASKDLSILENCTQATLGIDEIYNLAADMGGMGFIENNKAACMLSVLINTHLLMAAKINEVSKFFFSSSACVYNADKQNKTLIAALQEDDAYPAMPEDGYGWEKLFSERMCRHFYEDYGLETRVARYHNIYGPNGTWQGGREKAPAALSRKVAEAKLAKTDKIEVWGDGEQTRSFTFIKDCIEGTIKLMESDVREPINIGSNELVSINGLTKILGEFAGITLNPVFDLAAPKGVRGRNSDNTKILKLLDWEPRVSLKDGLKETYQWIEQQVINAQKLAQGH
jgi:nucleoside-diphosphate-sugar epimerase